MLPAMAATTVVFDTDLGTFEIALDEERAPKSVANFLRYVDEGHYAGTIFHRTHTPLSTWFAAVPRTCRTPSRMLFIPWM